MSIALRTTNDDVLSSHKQREKERSVALGMPTCKFSRIEKTLKTMRPTRRNPRRVANQKQRSTQSTRDHIYVKWRVSRRSRWNSQEKLSEKQHNIGVI